MGTQTVTTKDTIIKFSVSPRFKKVAQKKAEEVGFSLSDLGRFLFGAYIHGDIITSPPSSLEALFSEAKKEYESGKTTSVKNIADLKKHLTNLRRLP